MKKRVRQNQYSWPNLSWVFQTPLRASWNVVALIFEIEKMWFAAVIQYANSLMVYHPRRCLTGPSLLLGRLHERIWSQRYLKVKCNPREKGFSVCYFLSLHSHLWARQQAPPWANSEESYAEPRSRGRTLAFLLELYYSFPVWVTISSWINSIHRSCLRHCRSGWCALFSSFWPHYSLDLAISEHLHRRYRL